jgi:hypothetical protein
MGTVCKAFAKPALFVDESAMHMVGRLSLSQLLLTLKYSMQIAFVSIENHILIHQENGFWRLTKLFFLYSSFDRFGSSTCHKLQRL